MRAILRVEHGAKHPGKSSCVVALRPLHELGQLKEAWPGEAKLRVQRSNP